MAMTLRSLRVVVAVAGGYGAVAAGCGSSSPSAMGGAGIGGTQGAAGQGGGVDRVAVTPVGAPTGEKVKALLDAAGGALVSADGRLTIAVPPGALTAAAELSVQAIANEAPGGCGFAYRLGPDGTTFSSPVKLTFAYGDADVAGSEPAALAVAFQDGMARWDQIKDAVRDDTARTISVDTAHFSDWSLLTGWQLTPSATTVMMGHAIDLVLEACGTEVSGSDDLVLLIHERHPDTRLFSVYQWTANGVVDGDATVGRISGAHAGGATYTAPAAAPQNNPIAVSAGATEKASGRKTVLSSAIFVNEHPTLVGTVTSRQVEMDLGLVDKTQASVTFTFNDEMMMYLPSAPSTLTVTRDIVANGCQAHATATATLGSQDGSIVFLDLGYFPTGATTVMFSGTGQCQGGAAEPFALDEQVEWWPNAVESVLAVRRNGTLEDGFVDQVLASGRTVSASWSLAPSTKP